MTTKAQMNGNGHQPVKKYAQIGAAVVARLKEAGEPLTSADLHGHSSVQALGVEKQALHNSVSELARKGVLRKVRIAKRPDQPNATYAYELGDGTPAVAVKKQVNGKAPHGAITVTQVVKPPVKPPVKTPARDPYENFVSIDLVKATGKVRLTFKGGFAIEIGVVDA